jgi:predicted nucleic acid-binding protein
MNIVDSSCWLEYFANSPVGDKVSSAIEDLQSLVVPSITLLEVFKKVLKERDEDSALLAVAHMRQGTVVKLDSDLSIYAAKVSVENNLALADSIIYATAKKYQGILWTQDKHFKNLDGVRYFDATKNP